MRTITTEELKAANRKALADGTLAAQAPVPECRYELVEAERVYRCAISCALTDEELRAIPPSYQTAPIGGAYLPVDFEDFCFARELQSAHDRWCLYGRDEPEHADDYRALIA